MYKQKESGWYKHLDFILLDLISIQLAYMLAYVLRYGFDLSYFIDIYLRLNGILLLAHLVVSFGLDNHKNILRRAYFDEFKSVFTLVSMVTLIFFACLYMGQNSKLFSRAVALQMWAIGIVFTYVERIVWKQVIRRRMVRDEYLQKMILVSEPERVKETIERIQEKEYSGFAIAGILLETEENDAEKVLGIPVLGKAKDSGNILIKEIVDEVFIDLPVRAGRTKEIQDNCAEMGITTHLNMGNAIQPGHTMVAEEYAGHMVLTSSIRFADPRQFLLKRMMDIAGGIAGLLITALLTVIIGPIIFVQSPGSIFFSQERVGRNGRRFQIYKFRSMYPDAEERKKELMKKNKMQGLMFKMDHDPRVIPIGHFIRKTSLDEFPQFWNVLKGDMSLVGTRPPTVDEYEQYEMHHKARLAAKPGLTGMWQVSGRSDIVDFEEVVRLDKEYIEKWNIGLDFKILLQTVKIVFTGKGSV